MRLWSTLDHLSKRPDRELGATEVIAWWEFRRIPFNIAVGAAGFAAIVITVCFSVAVGTECGIPDPPLFAVFAIIGYGILANVCYTAGWVVELLFIRSSEHRSAFGAKAFRWGVLFSVFITLLPGIVIPLLCIVARLATGKWDSGPE